MVSFILFWTDPTGLWCNMFQTLLRRKNMRRQCQMNNLQGLSDTVFFFSYKHDIFIIKKLGHIYHKEFMKHVRWDVIIVHRWDWCWKCQFHTDVKIENYYHHHVGEQLLFYKKVHIKIQSKKRDVLVICILLQETKNSNLFDKSQSSGDILSKEKILLKILRSSHKNIFAGVSF